MNAFRRHLPALSVALLALTTSITSLNHGFTYDDRWVVESNDRIHHLTGLFELFRQTYWPPSLGGDGYRPVVMSLFTLEWAAGGGAPWMFHLGNIVLAILAAVAVRWCAAVILPPLESWMAGALFAVHPVHVEVTGNIVGQSELIVAVCLAFAIGLYLRARRYGQLKGRDLTAILMLYTVGMFAKEHAIILPALLVAAEFTVLMDSDGWWARARRLRPLMLGFVGISLVYFMARSATRDDLLGFETVPVFRFLHLSTFDRIATMMTEMPRVARLLVFPAHMSADYSPPDVTVAHGPHWTQLPGLMICLGVLLLAFMLRRRASTASFGLFWIIVAYAPVSNIFVATGFVTAERTLFFPSVGVVILAGCVGEWVKDQGRPLEWIGYRVAAAILLCLGIARSIDRQRVWKSNGTLVAALAVDAPDGYRAHFIRGRYLGWEQGDMRGMEREIRHALTLFPFDASMTLTLADAYTSVKAWKSACELFQWSYAIEPRTGQGRYSYVYCLAKLNRWRDVRDQVLVSVALVPGSELKQFHRAIVYADSIIADSARAPRAPSTNPKEQ